jgi:hypothetical protein
MALQSAASAPKTYRCYSCGGTFFATDGYDANGAFICASCYEQQTAAATAAASPPAAITRQPPRYDGIIQGARILQAYSICLMVLGFVYIGLGLAGAIIIVAQSDKGDARFASAI